MASRTAHRQISPVYTLRFEIEDEHGTQMIALQYSGIDGPPVVLAS
jgi:hypothetical protein